jgi:hypothetical protein
VLLDTADAEHTLAKCTYGVRAVRTPSKPKALRHCIKVQVN